MITSATNKLEGDGITPAERPAHIPADWVQHPDGPDTSNAPPSFEGVEGSTQVEPGGIIYMSGKETLGQTITLVDGNVVKLPADVYTKHYVGEVFCILGEELEDGTWIPWPPCPETPFRILAREDTVDTILFMQDGSFMVVTENPATLERVAATFADVIEQTGKTPIMDPRLPFVGEEMKTNALP
jgi:hypothetical protein